MTSVPGDSAENSGRSDDGSLDGDLLGDRSADTDPGLGPAGRASDAASVAATGEGATASNTRAESVAPAAVDGCPVGSVEPRTHSDQLTRAEPVATHRPAGASVDRAVGTGQTSEVEPLDGETRAAVRLLRRFGGRAFALAFVAGITGLTTVALVLGLAGFALVLAPVRGVRRGGGPAAPGPPGW
ncbi:hypothetical protein [Amycolatopsis orientalis]|uniref:hypothetical protein n=1 Tax=Amycolatopsis orientalis TaxID=31958 RepID=UPI00055E8571|nr:hypothetical protein [Amycolatopsis orientalis]